MKKNNVSDVGCTCVNRRSALPVALDIDSCEDTDFNGESHEKCAFIVREALVGDLDVQSQMKFAKSGQKRLSWRIIILFFAKRK